MDISVDAEYVPAHKMEELLYVLGGVVTILMLVCCYVSVKISLPRASTYLHLISLPPPAPSLCPFTLPFLFPFFFIICLFSF